MLQWLPSVTLFLLMITSSVIASCDALSPAFPLPHLDPKDKGIRDAYAKIKDELKQALKESGVQDLSYSVAVTSTDETLFELHHTATERDKKRPGVQKVDGSSFYRIASNTKAFTVLALLQLQKAGKLNLDDPVNQYLPALEKHKTGALPWKDITLRTLATQLSGIPRNLGMVDIADTVGPKLLGLPDVSADHEPACDSIWNYTRTCTKRDLYTFLHKAEPLFAPKQQSTYSNVNFILLGLVIEKVSGSSYVDYLQQHVLDELDLSRTTFETPDDAFAVLPKGQAHFFDVSLGVQNPTGGLYSTSDDMMKWARYILTHYNGLSPVINWLQPQSFATGMKTFYGMPWEIFRTNEILSYTDRPVTFITKGGGWPGYTSIVAVVPEYGLGFTALVGASELFSNFPGKIAGIVGQHMVEAADSIAQQQVSKKHVGKFAAASDQNINSSITISHSDAKGVHITSWISDSVDVLEGYRKVFIGGKPEVPMRLQLVPTLLFKDEANQAGEIWRIASIEGQNPNEKPNAGPLNKDFCVTNLDVMAFDGMPLEEVVFWSQGDDGVYSEIELTAWRIKMGRTSEQVKHRQSTATVMNNIGNGQSILQSLFHRIRKE